MKYDGLNEFSVTKKILMVEDNPGDARIVELLLGQSDFLNYEIVRKGTLHEAIEFLNINKNIDAILLDLTLPDSMGFETLEKLLKAHPNQNVIVLTGYSDKTLGVKAVMAGAQDFLVKGIFDGDLLAKSLRFSIERKNTIKRLEESQRIAHIGNWEFNDLTREINASSEFYRILNISSKSELERNSLEDEGSPLYILKSIHKEAKAKEKVQQEIKIKSELGTVKYLHIQCRAEKDGNTTIFTGILQDITERKKAEAEMYKSQERYQDIFTKSKDSVIIADLNGSLLDFNQTTIELFGFTSDELLHTDLLSQARDTDFKSWFLNKIINHEDIVDYEVTFLTKEKEERICSITANILDEENDSFNAVIRDLTEQKHAEEIRKRDNLEREAAVMKEELISKISHEMRTPMNAILGMSNLMLNTQMTEEQEEYIKSMHQSSEILLGIVNDILEISTLKNGKIIFNDNTFSLQDVLDNLVNVMQYKIQEKNLSFELDIDKNLPPFIIGDKLRLNQILLNLVGNAIKFTEEGKIKILVNCINTQNNNVTIRFEIADTGIGIPEESLKTIFNSFTRVKNKDKLYEGTGLGLSIAKGYVEQQGGKIWVESEYKVGSNFFFELSFQATENPEEQASKVVELLSEDAVFDLLLVEDHKMNQLVAKKTLKKKWKNINITIANHGKEAIELLQKNNFDIILMDIQMPIMDGFEATKMIRTSFSEPKKNTPILAMTAHANIAKQQQYNELKMDGFVLKPFDPADLFENITKFIKKIDRYEHIRLH